MLDYLKSLPAAIHDHFAAMSALILIVTILKIVFPFIAYLMNRIFEYRSYKNFSKIEGVSDARAREIAQDIWRPKSKPPKWFLAFRRKLSRKNIPPLK
ncbi:hypothetical protein EGM70_04805 [Enterobacteriaceae bacterium 89]|nr:hypothetical protein [Enterobacteriaceae bacterium 89]